MLGFGIFLLAAGAIVAFAVPGLAQVPGVDWMLIGYILMGAGLLVTIAGAVQMARRSGSRTVRSTSVDPGTGARVDRVERRDDVV
ncbi:DUF6458 family protein [Agrococcus jejuensis]|uniref:DUF6458 domain-containing protein n=1 Tax=Agrococcus jejuensis TaxID=399736 RepID=A0A1G8FU26_9MICO|nr:DUF6458 family protein [Agrococcus jejuensis]SDH85622.1 hypothetical protein SAMN04489720_2618 [Agrococcus jejuensis]